MEKLTVKIWPAPGVRNRKFYLAPNYTFEKKYLAVKGLSRFFSLVTLYSTHYRVAVVSFNHKSIQIFNHEQDMCLCCWRLELNGHKRRLTWEATPRSIHDGVQSAINTSDCLMFDSNVAQLFADNGNLSINVTINMCWLWTLHEHLLTVYINVTMWW